MQVVNIVTIVHLSSELDLNKIHHSIKNTEFTNQASRWLKMRLMPENIYVAFYKSGKFSFTGLKSFDSVEKIAQRILSILKKINPDIEIKEIKINTAVFVGDLKKSLNLERISCNLDVHHTSYEPEQFPAIIYRDTAAVFTIFSTGKIIITKLKSIEEAETAFNKLKQQLKNFE